MKVIELLAKFHHREQFDCGRAPLNQFLRQTTQQHIRKGISRTFVLIDSALPQEIIGFVTLTLCEVRIEKFPPSIAKKYPAKVPGVKLARLAVDKKWQGQGIGELLLVSAMERALLVANTAGGIGLFVDAKDVAAQTYYARYGFVSLEDCPLLMFLPLSQVTIVLS